MNKGISAALIIVGVALTIWGARASQSFGSEMSELFTGAPADRTIWLLVGGIAATVIGLYGLLRGSRGR
jgi:hypothetical protein